MRNVDNGWTAVASCFAGIRKMHYHPSFSYLQVNYKKHVFERRKETDRDPA